MQANASNINPITSGGGQFRGINAQVFVGGRQLDFGLYNLTGTGVGLDVTPFSLEGVYAFGSGPWDGYFHAAVGSVGAISGSIFWSPNIGVDLRMIFPQGMGDIMSWRNGAPTFDGWIGVSLGYSTPVGKLPSDVAFEEILYEIILETD